MKPYLLHPAVQKDAVYFCHEDDLWVVDRSGGQARRLSSNKAALSRPLPSPDGKWIALTSEEEGYREVARYALDSGVFERWSYFGVSSSFPIQWRSSESLVVTTPAFHMDRVYEAVLLHLDGRYEKLSLGPVTHLAWDEKLGVVIERNSHRPEPAHWKGYRGGTRGRFFWGQSLDSEFVRLLPDKDTNLSRPLWAKGRLWFCSDQSGISQLCSVKPDGSDLKTHTKSKDCYVRNPHSDGRSIVFHQGGDLGVFDLSTNRVSYPKVQVQSTRSQSLRKWAGASTQVEHISLNGESKEIAVTLRGQIQIGDPWNDGVNSLTRASWERLRFAESTSKADSWMLVRAPGLDRTGFPSLNDQLELWQKDSVKPAWVVSDKTLGRVMRLECAAEGSHFAVVNHKNEIWVGDWSKKTLKKKATNRFRHMRSVSFSPDGRYLAFIQNPVDRQSSRIEVLDLKDGKIHPVTELLTHDYSPSFDPGGKFLYLLTNRDLDPVYDTIHFDLGFPRTTIAAAIVLSKTDASPWVGVPDLEASKPKKAKPKLVKTEIDFDGICDRLLRIPVPTANYTSIWGLDGGRVLLASEPISGSLDSNWLPGSGAGKTKLEIFELKSRKTTLVADSVNRCVVAPNGKAILYTQGAKARLVPVDSPSPEGTDVSRKTGWMSLDRFGCFVVPADEWKQIFAEIWRLQKENFWDLKMSGIEWNKAWELYSPLVERVGSRAQLSDLIWELQGELGTSHAYDIGGDYRVGPFVSHGSLGVDFEFRASNVYLQDILKGDSWDPKVSSPFLAPGVTAKIGDRLVSINGQAVTPSSLGPLLMNRQGQELRVVLESKGRRHTRVLSLNALNSELRYRHWVRQRAERVAERSKGRVGYIHVPDMGAVGYSEFHRHFVSQVYREALLVDLRFNGGGHVSQLLLEKLARKRFGFSRSRHLGDMPFPDESPTGLMLALTNEYAGSDGDIGSHTFKMRGLGLLVGKRTWGGVVGIWPQQILVDGSVTTQPEFGHWVSDAEWRIENYGTDPDIEVDNWPQDYRNNRDAQLERGLDLLLESLDAARPWSSEAVATEPTVAR